MSSATGTSLYAVVKATGGYIANHESDLYIEVNDVNKEILSRYPLEKANARTFRDQTTGKLCWDVPFAFDPYWERLGFPKAPTLDEALASRGWTHRKENDDQRRTIYDAQGNRLGSFTAEEGWAYLYRTAEVQA